MQPIYAYESMRYGFFVHYVACFALYKDGSSPKTYDEAADGFDVPAFADSIAEMKAEYLIFTAWHYRMLPLYPSAVTEKWRPGCSVKRDLLGEIIDAIRARGIRVILYTHPRDGHDFVGTERVACGWGEGTLPGAADTPNPETFRYETWNRYVMELYDELLARYGDRIDGIYTDGMGPGRFDGASHRSLSYEFPIVDYLGIRKRVKAANPDIAIMQNGFGCLFSDDFIMPEGFFGYESAQPDVRYWPACDKALAMTPFAGWTASGHYGEDVSKMTAADVARFTIFQASCTSAGGTCWASGPYCGGGWDVGVMETMREVARHMERLSEGVKNVVRSASWPTVSGDTLASRGDVFACSSKDRGYEYIHVMRLPEDRVIRLPASEDGARFGHPRALAAHARVCDFCQDESGISFRIDGEADELDTVVRLRRETGASGPVWTWIDDSDKRIRYSAGDWKYNDLGLNYETKEPKTRQLGCYECDTRSTSRDGARLDTWFEGDEIELYGVLDPEGGSADVLIDDIRIATVSERAETRTPRALLCTSGSLGGGIHTFSVVAKGSGLFEFDAIRIRK